MWPDAGVGNENHAIDLPRQQRLSSSSRHRRLFVSLLLVGGLVAVSLSKLLTIGFDTGVLDHALYGFFTDLAIFSENITVFQSSVETMEQASSTTVPVAVEESSKQKPLMVLYVGIHKTATTFLERLFAQDTFKEVMKRDNFEYLGTLPQAPPGSGFLRHHPDTFFHDTMGLDNLVVGYPNYTGIDDRCPLNLSSKVNERFKEARGRHINALVLCEYLSHLCPQQIEVLANVLNPYWRVKVILNYRPIYAWFPSYQNQINAKSTKDIWPDKPHYQGGFPRRLYDLDDDEPTTSRMFHAMARHGKHLAEIVYDNYHQHFDDAEVLPAHVLPQTWGLCEIPILGLLFCRVFDTPQICQAIESGEVKKPGVFQNEAVNDKYSVMADLAYENNRIPRYLTRRRVKSVIRKNYLKLEAGQETPIRCMSNETMERLETFSLSSEQRLFRDHPWAVNATDAARHHADFQRIWKDSRCHVDLKKLMFEPRWLELFRRLER